MSDDSSSLLTALAKIDVLRHAAANAAPAIEELLAVGLSLEMSEAEALSAIGVPRTVALWCRKVQRQGMVPAQG
jgi:hypothetical protein